MFGQNSITFTKVENNSLVYQLPGPEQTLKSDIDQILQVPELFNSQISVSIYSIDKEKYLYQLNENQNFVPASILKLYSTFSTLFFLGEDYKYQTKLYKRGYVDNRGNLDGDLVIFSNGNPGIDYRYFNNADSIFFEWLKILDNAGIRNIKGNLIIDQSWFLNNQRNNTWMLEDIVFDYAPDISAVNLNQNSFILNVRADINKTISSRTIPKISQKVFDNDISVINSINIKDLNEYYDFKKERIIIDGVIGNSRYDNYKLNYSYPSGQKFFGDIFKSYLENNDLNIEGELLIKEKNDLLDYDKFEIMDIFYSEPIDSLIFLTNHESNNFMAEIFVRSIAKEKTGIGSTEKGLQQIEYLIDDIGINSKNIRLIDGSGLSRKNLISSYATVKLLNYIYKTVHFEPFYNSLPSPGEGTLERRMKNSLAEKNLKAKTGSMSGVSNIAGYVKTRDDELLAFAIFVNNFTAPANSIVNIQDLICMRLAGFTRKIDFLNSKADTLINKNIRNE